MDISKIEFRVSIDKNKDCSKCHNFIDTKNGFIAIIGEIHQHNYYNSTNASGRANLCLACFGKLLKQKEEYEKDKEKIYKKLVKDNEMRIKKNVIRGLR